MKIDFAARVEIGIKETNDDRVLVDGNILDQCCLEGTVEMPAVVAVCDGCGGYYGGNIAAQTVLEILSKEEPLALIDPNYLSQTLNKCIKAVMEKKEEFPQYSEMCTTIAGCIFSDNSISFYHSGDSRVYRIDQWGLSKMTRDHSVVQEMVDMGEITPEEAADHPKRNVITRCIGIDGLPPEIYVSNTTVNPGDIFVFCSDGLWEYISESDFMSLSESGLPLKQIANELVELALKQGSEDNISVCICAGQGTSETQENAPFILD